mmetsp:Transcript_53914/g.161331  ORF Transcript_53914/g.161331 Transcript_53914/m.161331 type:complete len:210 (-) Transcript_53914:3578-4207(-)
MHHGLAVDVGAISHGQSGQIPKRPGTFRSAAIRQTHRYEELDGPEVHVGNDLLDVRSVVIGRVGSILEGGEECPEAGGDIAQFEAGRGDNVVADVLLVRLVTILVLLLRGAPGHHRLGESNLHVDGIGRRATPLRFVRRLSQLRPTRLGAYRRYAPHQQISIPPIHGQVGLPHCRGRSIRGSSSVRGIQRRGRKRRIDRRTQRINLVRE